MSYPNIVYYLERVENMVFDTPPSESLQFIGALELFCKRMDMSVNLNILSEEAFLVNCLRKLPVSLSLSRSLSLSLSDHTHEPGNET